MKIVIVGAGEVRYYLVKRLVSEGDDAIIIEIDPEIIVMSQNHLMLL